MKFLIPVVISLAVWFQFSYPQLAISNFSIDRVKAARIAEEYLNNERHADSRHFQKAAIFSMDQRTNRYLQKTIGFHGLQNFIKQHDFDLFYWLVRFFKENTKEEYLVEISSSSGEIIGFRHTIDENDARREISKEEALQKAEEFLKEKFKLFDPAQCTIRSNLAVHRDNRSDYVFSWQKNDVNIPWSHAPNSGTGKLLIEARVSGDELLSFNKNAFLVPDQFNRDIDNRKDLSRNIMVIIRILVTALFTYGVFLIIIRQNHLAMQTTKKFYIMAVVISFGLSLLSGFNQFEDILFSYKTTSPLNAYLWRFALNTIISAVFINIAILIPSLSGELLHYETSPNEKTGSFLHYIRTTFASRYLAESIVLGYLVCAILLGMQSFLFKIGQTHLGVWAEHKWIDNISTAYFPFLAAFTIGFKASFAEEIMYRFYAINLGKKIFNKISLGTKGGNILIAVLLSSLIWGFSHSNYPIFPVWFRGIEVTCLGIFLALIYLKFGIIPVLIAHYLFDVFWNNAGYIFGTSTPFYFYSSLSILLLPFGLAAVAFFMNKKEEERPLRWHLNKHQLYNLEILKAYLNTNKNAFMQKSQDQIKREITLHGWDPAVVEVALEDFFGNGGTSII
ncbi:MAG: CPBP family intramembrane metalloprotease [Candidatus Omnitrophica bacterium]|nr:CPBP family intramembrane metalloprotease [Candidatus Omnitrophota bacterium]